jgi:hypothetical protein
MTLGTIPELAVHHLIALCHNDGCGHQVLVDVPAIPTVAEMPLWGTGTVLWH